ncbi:MAG: hypothetical protein HFI71_11160 [Lachnospiraceae bacterium]|nr:hypothetical protein [Lachnospiraceae bacterium]
MAVRTCGIGHAQGRVQMTIEMGQYVGIDDAAILKKLQDKAGLSPK